jgi:hypothetical protein
LKSVVVFRHTHTLRSRCIYMRSIIGIAGLFLVISALAAPAFAAERHVTREKDGNDWISWGPVTKTAFVEGFKSGSDYVIRNNDGLANFPLPVKFDNSRADKVQRDFYNVCKLPDPRKDVTFPADDVILLVARTKTERKKVMLDLSVADYTAERFVDGIDSFYHDHYDLRNIKIQDAVYYVRKKLEKAPAEELNRILNYLKGGKEQPDWLTMYDEKGKIKRLITFP